jgi:predicted DCC family thiol-disulfide oxidoreductase YuxK
VCELLPFPWCLGAAIAVIPRPVRDAIYGWVAAVRYRLLGRVGNCALLTPAQRARFVTGDGSEVNPEK